MTATQLPSQPYTSSSSWPRLHSDEPGLGVDSTRDDTLARISDIANDVEMREETSQGMTMGYLVLDTNVLIDNLNALRTFSEDLDNATLPISMKIIVPNAVLSELDGLKKRQGLSWFARTASTLLLQKIQEKRTWKVQAHTETVHRRPQDHEHDRAQDISIFDCCLYFRTKGPVVLLTNDTNLRTVCENEEDRIQTIAPGKRQFSSRDLAYDLFAHEIDLNQFRGQVNTPKYGPARSAATKRLARTEAPRAADFDRMDIDDDSSLQGSNDDYIPSHALDALHLQIIDHFSIVLKELASRVRHEFGDAGPPAQSQYAPMYRRKEFELWNMCDCLGYLGTKKPLNPSQPPLQAFLLRRSEDRQWRRGQDWPRQAWMNALDALEELGRVFEDKLVLLSLQELRPHVVEIFHTPLRPTGL